MEVIRKTRSSSRCSGERVGWFRPTCVAELLARHEVNRDRRDLLALRKEHSPRTGHRRRWLRCRHAAAKLFGFHVSVPAAY